MKTETFEFVGLGGIDLPACLWMPDGEVKAILQITHGMTEHMGRYETLAEYLCPLGIAVAGTVICILCVRPWKKKFA